jgi:hypothetical protein
MTETVKCPLNVPTCELLDGETCSVFCAAVARNAGAAPTTDAPTEKPAEATATGAPAAAPAAETPAAPPAPPAAPVVDEHLRAVLERADAIERQRAEDATRRSREWGAAMLRSKP